MVNKVYITKYALTKGILCKEAKVETSCYNDNIIFAYIEDEYGGVNSYKIGTEAFYKLEDAVNDFKNRRNKKIESLKKQIKKLEKLKMEII